MAETQITANSTDISDSVTNITAVDWWSTILEEDFWHNPLSVDAGEFWSGTFIPPPPRPLFLEETATTDGLTTCDLCTWALKSRTFLVDAATESPGEFGWVLTLVIVSIISATIGAVIMITVLHCRSRIKCSEQNDSLQTESTHCVFHPTIPQTTSDKETREDYIRRKNTVWSWLTSRHSAPPKQLTSPTLPAENHYTHMNEAYSVVEDQMYAELNSDYNSSSQNNAYTDPDASTSSAPSSAYYSDLSISANPDRTYEVIGQNYWEGQYQDVQRPRLTAINENMPSEYV